VLEALLQGNLQRNKSKEQHLREFELWLEVEKPLARARKAVLNGKDASGEKCRKQEAGDSRDLAAKRVGFKSGSDAEKALKALKAFELWLEVEKPLSANRRGGDRKSDQGGEIPHGGRIAAA
jgi:hypothetical protein